ncbi:MAG: energy-coupling factor ABC transporter ATP-binding protein [Candidatus Omnitrophica bacterium]|nr:energy-coupling factor ABC transporter ATP-binding protein [Candidatus Omnitrophota bacterium]
MIHFKNVFYSYPTRDAPTINGITLDIERGDFVLVSGPTGCGKTTLVKMLNGIIPHLSKGKFSGELTILGRDVCSSSMEELTEEVGLIFQSPDDQIISNTVEEEIAFGLENLGFNSQQITQRVDWALKKTNIVNLKERDTKELSGGQKQRVVIASQIAMQPKILVFDEPLSQLDPKGAKEVMECIVELNKEGITIIIIEHRVSDIARYVNKALLLNNGRIAYYGDTKQSFRRALSIYKRLGIQIPEEVELSLGLGIKEITFSYEKLKSTFENKRQKQHLRLCEKQFQASTTRSASHKKIVSLQEVDFEYVKGKPVLEGLTLDFYEGQNVALMGANGSGKSTLISLIAGINKLSKGIVELDGQELNSIKYKQRTSLVGMLIQNPDLMLFCETVEKELLFGPEHKKIKRSEAISRMKDVLENLGLSKHKDDAPFALSVGQRLRTALGAVLTLQPSVLLLDEPTTGQNQENIVKVMKTLKELSFIKSIIFCTHDIYTAMYYADRIIVLNSGQVVFDGESKNIFNDPDLMKKNSLSVPAPVRLSKDCGCQKTFLTAEELIKSF